MGAIQQFLTEQIPNLPASKIIGGVQAVPEYNARSADWSVSDADHLSVNLITAGQQITFPNTCSNGLIVLLLCVTAAEVNLNASASGKFFGGRNNLSNRSNVRLTSQYSEPAVIIRANNKWYMMGGGAQLLNNDRLNYAASAQGATATASSTFSTFVPDNAINGVRHTNNNINSGSAAWIGGAGTPKWIEVDFNQTRTIDTVNVFTLADALNYNTDPTLADTFTFYGLTAFDIEYWDGADWKLLQAVTGNNKVWYQIEFSPLVTEKIRLHNCVGADGEARVVELEAVGFA